MKAIFSADAGKGGFIRTSIATSHHHDQARFGLVDAVIVSAFLVAIAALVVFVAL